MEEGAAPTADLSEFRMLNPVSKRAMYMRNAIVLVLGLALAAVAVYFIRDKGWFAPAASAIGILAAALVAYELVSPLVLYKYYRYRMDDDCMEVRKGVIVRSHTLVPVERVHQVNVRRGPILRRYGLADVTVTTAGGVVSLDYLDEDVAEDVAENLNERIISMLKARE